MTRLGAQQQEIYSYDKNNLVTFTPLPETNEQNSFLSVDQDDQTYRALSKLSAELPDSIQATTAETTDGKDAAIMHGFDERLNRASDRLGQLTLKNLAFAEERGRGLVRETGSASGLDETERKLIQQIPYMTESLRLEQALFLLGRGTDDRVKQGEKILAELVRDNPSLQGSRGFETRVLQKYVEMAVKRQELGLPAFKSVLRIADVIPDSVDGWKEGTEKTRDELFLKAQNTLKSEGMEKALPVFKSASEKAEQSFLVDRNARVSLFLDDLKVNSEIACQSLSSKNDLDPLFDKKARLSEKERALSYSSDTSSQIRRELALIIALEKISSPDEQLFDEGSRDLRKHLSESPTIMLDDQFNKKLLDAYAKHFAPQGESPGQTQQETGAASRQESFREHKLDKDADLDNELKSTLGKLLAGAVVTGAGTALGAYLTRVARSYMLHQEMRASYGIDAVTSNTGDVVRTYLDPVSDEPRSSTFKVAGLTRDTQDRLVVLEKTYNPPNAERDAAAKRIPLPENFNPARHQFGPTDNAFRPVSIEGKIFYSKDGTVYSQKGRYLEPTSRFITQPESSFIRDGLPGQLASLGKASRDSKGLGYASEYIKGRVSKSPSITMRELAVELAEMAEKTQDKPFSDGLKQAIEHIRSADATVLSTDRPRLNPPADVLPADTQVQSLPKTTDSNRVQEQLQPLPNGVSENLVRIDGFKYTPKGTLNDGRIWMTTDKGPNFIEPKNGTPKVSKDFDPKAGKYDNFIPLKVDGRELFAAPHPATEVYFYYEPWRRLMPATDVRLASPGEFVWEANKPANPYADAYKQSVRQGVDLERERGKLASQFTWSGIPTKEAMVEIYNFAQSSATNPGAIVSFGAGNGYWEKMMETMGLNLDGTKFDIAPPGGTEENRWYSSSHKWTSVQKGEPADLAKHGDKTMFLSWPPYNSPMAADALKEYIKAAGDGGRLIFVGEQPDVALKGRHAQQLTAGLDFFNLLDSEFKLVKITRLDQVSYGFDQTRDAVYMYERRPASERARTAPVISEQEIKHFIDTKSGTSSSGHRLVQYMKEAVFSRDFRSLNQAMHMVAQSSNADGILRTFQQDFEKLGLDVSWNTSKHGNEPSAKVTLRNPHNGWEIIVDTDAFETQVRREHGQIKSPLPLAEPFAILEGMLNELRSPGPDFKTETKPASSLEKFINSVPDGWGENTDAYRGDKTKADLRILQMLREGIVNKDAKTLELGMQLLNGSLEPEKHKAIADQFKKDMKSLGLDVPILEKSDSWQGTTRLVVQDPLGKDRFEMSTDWRMPEYRVDSDPNFKRISDHARKAMGETNAPGKHSTEGVLSPGENALLKLKSENPELSKRIDKVLETVKALEKTQQNLSNNDRIKWSMAEGAEFLKSADGLERLERLLDAAVPPAATRQADVPASVNVVMEEGSQKRVLPSETRSTDPSVSPELAPNVKRVTLPGGLEIFVDKSTEKAVAKYLDKYNQDANFKELLADKLKSQQDKIDKETTEEKKAKLIEEKTAMESEITRYKALPEAERTAYREQMLGEAMNSYNARVTGRQRAVRALGTLGTMILVGMIAEHAIDMMPEMSETGSTAGKPKIL